MAIDVYLPVRISSEAPPWIYRRHESAFRRPADISIVLVTLRPSIHATTTKSVYITRNDFCECNRFLDYLRRVVLLTATDRYYKDSAVPIIWPLYTDQEFRGN